MTQINCKRILICAISILSVWLPALGQTPVPIEGNPPVNSFPDVRESAAKLNSGFNAVEILASDAKLADFKASRSVPGQQPADKSLDLSRQSKEFLAGKYASKASGTPSYLNYPLKTGKRGVPKITEGYYIAKDFVHEGSEVNCVMNVVKDTTDPTMIHIHNFYGLGETVDAVVTETGELTILPQLIWDNTTYGKVYIFPIEYTPEGIKYYTTIPVKGTLDENGVIILGTWGAIVGEGAKEGQLLAAIDNGEYHPANATAKATKISSGEASGITFPIYIEEEYPGMAKIYNFGTTAVGVRARIQAGGKVSVSPQYIVSLALYGDFYCYPLTESGAIDTQSPISGSLADGKMTFGPWICGNVAQPSLVALYLSEMTINLSDPKVVTIPESYGFNLEGTGTQANPYLIKNTHDLLALSYASQTESFPNTSFRLTADIDMEQIKGYIPIGTSKAAFNGIFDGDGHTISNLKIDAVAYPFQGLFGAAFTNSVIRNLNLKNASLEGEGYYLGLLAGYSQGAIENCHVEGYMNSTGCNVGGVVGRTYGKLQNCSFSGTVKGAGYVGGVVGYSFGQILSCHSDAIVEMPAYLSQNVACLGGVAGLSQSYSTAKEGMMKDCWFSGTVRQSAGYGYAGGLSGYAYAISMTNCFNIGTITSTSELGSTEMCGGLAGIIWQAEISDCYNAGDISSAGYSANVGGLMGYITTTYSTIGGMLDPIDVRRCYNTGSVTARARTSTCGIFGAEFTSTIEGVSLPSDKGFTDVVYDYQAVGVENSRFGKPTEWFTGALPSVFSSSVWSANTSMYPTLRTFATLKESTLSSVVVEFSGLQTARAMKNSATLHAPEGTEWNIIIDGNKVQTSGFLEIEGNTLKLKGEYANATVAASMPECNASRLFEICVVPKRFDGEGTAESPYLIKNENDFKLLHEAVMNYDHRGDHFLQTADVDFGLKDDFSGVGSGNHLKEFAGIFDGGNHFVKGLKVQSIILDDNGRVLNGSYNYGGLFHIGSETSVIRNVNIDKSCSFNFYSYAGPVIGATKGKVENCRNYADVAYGKRMIGGIAGQINAGGSIEGCYNAGNISTADLYTGGIAGQNFGDILECQNEGKVNATANYCGGIAGASSGKIYNNVNSANISGVQYLGGIVGYNSDIDGMGDLNGNISSGMIHSTGLENTGCVAGVSSARENVENNYFDASINNLNGCSNLSNGFKGVSTSELVNDECLPGLDKEILAFSQTAYPSLKKFADETEGAKLRSAFILFAKGGKCVNVNTSVALSKHESLEWSLEKNTDFTISDGVLNIRMPESTVAEDNLTAKIDGKIAKQYNLKAIPSILDGMGSIDDPFRITKSDDLHLLATFMESSGMDYEGYFFKVLNDIQYAENDTVRPIGRTGAQFNGTFDGNGKKISGVFFADDNLKTGKNVGLFGTIGSKGYVHNLSVDGSIVANSYAGAFASSLYGKIYNCTSTADVSAKSGYAGGFVGNMYDGAIISNCEFSGNVGSAYESNINYLGGIAANQNAGAEILYCTNKGTVGNNTETGASGSQYTGGITGANAGWIRNCTNNGIIKGRLHVGGISGRTMKTGCYADCENNADIDILNGSYVGGISPYAVGGAPFTADRCVNRGNLRGKGYVGGIFGQIISGAHMDSCVNTGAIKGYNPVGYGVGGVIGQIAGTPAAPCEVRNCWNEGAVYNETQSTGGFMGKGTSNILIENCWNEGDVEANLLTEDQAKNGVGGFAGAYCGTARRIWNSGNVKSNVPACAGLIGTGAMPITFISEAANFGNVELNRVIPTKGYTAAGLWGGYGPVNISDSYNTGSITAPDWVAGIDAAMHSNANGGSTIERCFNIGTINCNDTSKNVSGGAMISEYTGTNPALMTVKDLYFDKNSAKETAKSLGTPISRKELMTKALSNAFIIRPNSTPVLQFFGEEHPVANLCAVEVDYMTSDGSNVVSGPFKAGVLPNVNWTSSDNLEIKYDGTVIPVEKGDGWLEASAIFHGKTYIRRFDVISATSGIDGTDINTIAKVQYYTPGGILLESPLATGVTIKATYYSDGTRKIEKLLAK